jgi:hypothetical protein
VVSYTVQLSSSGLMSYRAAMSPIMPGSVGQRNYSRWRAPSAPIPAPALRGPCSRSRQLASPISRPRRNPPAGPNVASCPRHFASGLARSRTTCRAAWCSFPLDPISFADRLIYPLGATAVVDMARRFAEAVEGLLDPMEIGLRGTIEPGRYHSKIAVRRRLSGTATHDPTA